jgi:hypothetical protein
MRMRGSVVRVSTSRAAACASVFIQARSLEGQVLPHHLRGRCAPSALGLHISCFRTVTRQAVSSSLRAVR